MNIYREQLNLPPSHIAEDHDLRSKYVERLIASTDDHLGEAGNPGPPRLIVQFWDDLEAIPGDVQSCLDTWSSLQHLGLTRQVFGDEEARGFIEERLDDRHRLAFRRCNHPAMRADYFRLCFLAEVGGLYVDADDVYQGSGLEDLFDTAKLQVQPLCYDIASGSMVEPFQAAERADNSQRIFYVNNNPLIAPPGHPIVASALDRATAALLRASSRDRDIQSLTGPGNLTACLVASAVESERSGAVPGFALIRDWESHAVTRWPLDYRSDSRNWRNWAHEGA